MMVRAAPVLRLVRLQRRLLAGGQRHRRDGVGDDAHGVGLAEFSFFSSLLLFKGTGRFLPIRVTPEQESIGLALRQYGEFMELEPADAAVFECKATMKTLRGH
jgi:hypothetical protein